MRPKYQKPPELYDGLRLHQNEHTGGCSPRVLAALAALGAGQVSVYPPYEAATHACANYLGVDPDRLSLLNGLDEGLMAASVAYLQPLPDGSRAEAIVPEPAFEILAFDAEVAGGRAVTIPAAPDYAFPLAAVLDAITPRTRVVFVTNPNNPTGVVTPLEAIREVAARVPPGAIVFVDEAYAEFSGVSFIPELDAHPNVVVGRTFSKAFGLAGLRVGAIAGHPDALEPIRLAVPVYSVNIAAVAAVQAALQDLEHVEDYKRQVAQSKALIYDACDRLGFGYVRSAANFVLVRVGPRAEALARGAAARGVYVRDRSRERGLEGCLRVGAGIVAHTRRCLEVFEEVLCDAA
ncbi:MAG: histidinol-phosphate transaminase [Vicinamibacterales bacterium]